MEKKITSAAIFLKENVQVFKWLNNPRIIFTEGLDGWRVLEVQNLSEIPHNY